MYTPSISNNLNSNIYSSNQNINNALLDLERNGFPIKDIGPENIASALAILDKFNLLEENICNVKNTVSNIFKSDHLEKEYEKAVRLLIHTFVTHKINGCSDQDEKHQLEHIDKHCTEKSVYAMSNDKWFRNNAHKIIGFYKTLFELIQYPENISYEMKCNIDQALEVLNKFSRNVDSGYDKKAAEPKSIHGKLLNSEDRNIRTQKNIDKIKINASLTTLIRDQACTFGEYGRDYFANFVPVFESLKREIQDNISTGTVSSGTIYLDKNIQDYIKEYASFIFRHRIDAVRTVIEILQSQNIRIIDKNLSEIFKKTPEEFLSLSRGLVFLRETNSLNIISTLYFDGLLVKYLTGALESLGATVRLLEEYCLLKPENKEILLGAECNITQYKILSLLINKKWANTADLFKKNFIDYAGFITSPNIANHLLKCSYGPQDIWVQTVRRCILNYGNDKQKEELSDLDLQKQPRNQPPSFSYAPTYFSGTQAEGGYGMPSTSGDPWNVQIYAPNSTATGMFPGTVQDLSLLNIQGQSTTPNAFQSVLYPAVSPYSYPTPFPQTHSLQANTFPGNPAPNANVSFGTSNVFPGTSTANPQTGPFNYPSDNNYHGPGQGPNDLA